MIGTIIFNFILGPIFMLIYATVCKSLYVQDYSEEHNYEYRKVHIPFIFYILSLIGLAIPYFNIALALILILVLFAVTDVENWELSFIDISGIEYRYPKDDPSYAKRKEQFEKDHGFLNMWKKILLGICNFLTHNINK
jgi:ABC-type dipeptide/oligopeptide/nickel transport system permease component